MKIAQILQFSGVVAGAALAVWPMAAGALQTAGSRGSQDPPPSYPGYTLVWSDEFNRDGRPDPKNWTYERGFVRNQELQWYAPENARVEGGLLVIEARRERVPNPAFKPSSTDPAARTGDWRSGREFADYTVGQPDHARAAQLAVRPFRDAGAHRHARGAVAGVLDARRHEAVAAQRRDRHHGVLPRHAARQRRVGRRGALSGDLGRLEDADRLVRQGVAGRLPRLAHGLGRARDLALGGRTTAERDRSHEDHQPGWHRHQPVPSPALSARQPRRRRHPGRRPVEDDVPGAIRGRLRARVSAYRSSRTPSGGGAPRASDIDLRARAVAACSAHPIRCAPHQPQEQP